MRLVLALLAVAATISVAVPAHADPTGNDATFIAELNQAGITFSDPAKAVDAAKTICEQMDKGTSAPDLVKQLTDVNPGFTLNGAVKFASIAASVYCPNYVAGNQGNTGNTSGGGGN